MDRRRRTRGSAWHRTDRGVVRGVTQRGRLKGGSRPRFRSGAAGAMLALVLIAFMGGAGLRAWRDLSRPEAFEYLLDRYLAPSLAFETVRMKGPGPGRTALLVHGKIGTSSAEDFRLAAEHAGLRPGDLVVLSSSGGDLKQATRIGEIVRAKRLSTAVGEIDKTGQWRPAYCASACVAAFAGGVERFTIAGSQIGVHRFRTPMEGPDPVAETQATTGMILGYMTRMGVSARLVELMSQTDEIRWIAPDEAAELKLVTRQVKV